MFIVDGEYNSVRVYADSVDSATLGRIKDLADEEYLPKEKYNIAMMPDVHAAKGCCVGTVIQRKDNQPIDVINPAWLGNDIGCGITVIPIGTKINLPKLDKAIREGLNSSMNENKGAHLIPIFYEPYWHDRMIDSAEILPPQLFTESSYNNMGTLGGGNHFIEVDEDSRGQYYLVIHSGSRGIGQIVYDYFMDAADKVCNGRDRYHGIISIDNHKTLFESYCMSVDYATYCAMLNRITIAKSILKKSYKYKYMRHVIHNYISKDNTICKGAIFAPEDRKIFIPLNMRDGILICAGKGNSDYLCCAPHGAGRPFPRSEVKNHTTFNQFKKDMKGIMTPNLDKSLLDESPAAYKPYESIKKYIEETVEILDIAKPVYNFKFGGNE